MPSRAHCDEVLQRAREAMARGPLSEEEGAEFASQQAAQDHAAWLRRHPEQVEPELPLKVAA